MTDLHPHWSATDREDRASGNEKAAHVPVGKRRVSRVPAALAGVGLVVLIGAFFVQGVQSLRAQLLDAVSITITDDGVTPETVTIRPGQEIAWTNTAELPHMISAESLCNAEGWCLYSDMIFQNDTARFTIPEDMPAGQYAYISETDPAIQGIIIVTEGATPPADEQNIPPPDSGTGTTPVDQENSSAPQESSTPAEDPLPPATETPTITTAPPEPQETQELQDIPSLIDASILSDEPPVLPPVSVAPRASVEIPRNPYTVGSSYLPSAAQVTTQPTHSGAPPAVTQHAPARQPQTGAATWIVAIVSIAGFAIAGRRMLRRTTVVR